MRKFIELFREAFLIELFKIRTKNYLFSFNLWVIFCIIIMINYIYSMYNKICEGQYFDFFTDLFLFSISFGIGYLYSYIKDKI